MTTRVLVVEDDELIGTLVEVNLRHGGHDVTWERSGDAALLRLSRERFDVLVLDHVLPGRDGLEVARTMRRMGLGTPILMLTVRAGTVDKVTALDVGIDDYMTKPFDVEELLARVRALVRRGQAAGEAPSTNLVAVSGGELDLDARRFRDASGGVHALSPTEAALLGFLAKNAGRTLTRSDIIEEVWGMDVVPPERTVDNFVLRLRRLVEADPERPRHLLTVRGRGYRFNP